MGEKGRNVKGEILLKEPDEVEWKMPDYIPLSEGKESFFDSPSFPYLDGTWCLRFWPNDTDDRIRIGLKRIHSTSHRNITFGLGIKVEDEVVFTPRMLNYDFGEDGDIYKCFLDDDSAVLQRNDTHVSHRGDISVFCMLSSGHSKDAVSQTNRSESTETPDIELRNAQKKFEDWIRGPSKELTGADKLSECFEKLFLSGDDDDIIIKVQDQEIRAHKLIITVRCPVFAAMLRHDTVEKNTGVITIEDCDPEAFREFLSFLYSGKLKNVSAENVINLYVIADKYQVDEVKSQCLEFMLRNMSDETFCDFISLALRHNERELLNLATDYFAKNVKTIILTVNWQRFHKEYPVESNELYIKAIAHLIPD